VVARVGSIRKAADELAITSTALNRRILSMEDELGVALFERLPTGVRLSVAGELFIHHARRQLADMERVKSQLADLAGERRGHVSIVCGHAMMSSFLPQVIADYRQEHPAVTFDVRVSNRTEYEAALNEYTADLALVFEPETFADFHCVLEVTQQIHLLFNQSHPLAGSETVRLSECLAYPMALPTRANGIRHLLEIAARRMSVDLPVILESDSETLLLESILRSDAVTVQIPIGVHKRSLVGDVANSVLDSRDVGVGRLMLGHLKGRHLPVAAARFLELLSARLDEHDG
jgi:DNA-binding transcriptional LysR family regulator